MSKKRIVLVGVENQLGQFLLQNLESDPSVESILCLIEDYKWLKNSKKIQSHLVDFATLESDIFQNKSHLICCPNIGFWYLFRWQRAALQPLYRYKKVFMLARHMDIKYGYLVSSWGAKKGSRLVVSHFFAMIENAAVSVKFDGLYRYSLISCKRSNQFLNRFLAVFKKWMFFCCFFRFNTYVETASEVLGQRILNDVSEAKPGIHIWDPTVIT